MGEPRTRVVNVKTAERGTFLYCGRAMPVQGFPRASPLANPYRVAQYGDQAGPLYVVWLLAHRELPVVRVGLEEARRAVEEGKALGCWCAPRRCHCEAIAALLAGDFDLLERMKDPAWWRVAPGAAVQGSLFGKR